METRGRREQKEKEAGSGREAHDAGEAHRRRVPEDEEDPPDQEVDHEGDHGHGRGLPGLHAVELPHADDVSQTAQNWVRNEPMTGIQPKSRNGVCA